MSYDIFTSKMQKRKKGRTRLLLTTLFTVCLFLFIFFSLKTYWNQNKLTPLTQFFLGRNGSEFISKRYAKNDLFNLRFNRASLEGFAGSSQIASTPEHRSKVFSALKRSWPQSKINPLEDQVNFYELSLTRDETTIHQKIVALLPGESFTLTSETLSSRNFVIAAAGATRDRLESVGQFSVITSTGEKLFSVRADGSLHRFPITTPEKQFTITWPANAPGVLLFFGSDDFKQIRSKVFITIDELSGELPPLPRSRKLLEEIYKKEHVAYFSKVFPTSIDTELNLATILSSQHPLITQSTDSPPQALQQCLEKTNTFSIRNNIVLGCDSCLQKKHLADGGFHRYLRTTRKSELLNSLKETLPVAGSFLHINIKAPHEKLALTWKSARSSDRNYFSWIFASLFTNEDKSLFEEEKAIQIDSLLEKLIKDLSPTTPDFVILVAKRTDAQNQSEEPSKLLRAHVEEGFSWKVNPKVELIETFPAHKTVSARKAGALIVASSRIEFPSPTSEINFSQTEVFPTLAYLAGCSESVPDILKNISKSPQVTVFNEEATLWIFPDNAFILEPTHKFNVQDQGKLLGEFNVKSDQDLDERKSYAQHIRDEKKRFPLQPIIIGYQSDKENQKISLQMKAGGASCQAPDGTAFDLVTSPDGKENHIEYSGTLPAAAFWAARCLLPQPLTTDIGIVASINGKSVSADGIRWGEFSFIAPHLEQDKLGFIQFGQTFLNSFALATYGPIAESGKLYIWKPEAAPLPF